MPDDMTIEPPHTPLDEERIALLAAVVNGGAVALLSGDWACAAVGSAVIAGIVCWVTTYMFNRRIPYRRALSRVILASVILILAIWQVWWTRSTLRQDAFRIAFNTEIPREVQNLKVKCYYMGGPGETLTLMRFKAAPEVMQRLLATSGLSPDTNHFPEYQSGAFSSQQLWTSAFRFANDKANNWWPASPALHDPLLYEKRPASTPTETTNVLWDRATQEVYVMITRG